MQHLDEYLKFHNFKFRDVSHKEELETTSQKYFNKWKHKAHSKSPKFNSVFRDVDCGLCDKVAQKTIQKWIHFAHSKQSEVSGRVRHILKRRCHECVLSQQSESEEKFASYCLMSSTPFSFPLHQVGHVELPLQPGQSNVVALNVPRFN